MGDESRGEPVQPDDGGRDDFRAFLEAWTDGDSVRAWARKIGMDQSTLIRQLARRDPNVHVVVALCREYRIPLLEAFVAAGFITSAEATQAAAHGVLQGATDRQLVEEMLRRVEAREAGPDLTEPVSDDVVNGQV